ncbi:single-stranded DNA-binding protein [Chitinophaga barathri]|uniref:Single-stranded DNA-binding protein n=1 Tax=Chitinophaga barathri TaxID=1647451 RepID=A0A3N4MM43_9BACT|nr:single-stranded DNA-binding protein [Chitinophaga barathri]RPD43136.1 hypothetical protein EG028_02240 [Chitinophaga barathri]
MELIVGTIVADATTTNLESGKTVVNFNMVVTDKYFSQTLNEWKERNRFFECRLWHRTGAGKHILKGQVMTITGIIGVRAYNNTAGEPVGRLIIDVNDFEWKGWANSPHKGTPRPTVAAAAFTTGATADDLPF